MISDTRWMLRQLRCEISAIRHSFTLRSNIVKDEGVRSKREGSYKLMKYYLRQQTQSLGGVFVEGGPCFSSVDSIVTRTCINKHSSSIHNLQSLIFHKSCTLPDL